MRHSPSLLSVAIFPEQIPSTNRQAVKTQEVDVPIANKNPELKNPFIIPGIRNLQIESQLNPNYNFENFLEGDSNRLARSAGLAVSNKPGGTSFNPLMVFGGVGLGVRWELHFVVGRWVGSLPHISWVRSGNRG